VTGLAQLDTGSALSYLIAVLLPALDVLIPVLPSETAVIAPGVATAGSVDPRIGVLAGLAALGAFLGDNAAYLLGRRFGPVIGKRVFAGERGAQRRAWAERSLNRFGARLIVVCRFIPGGRTAVTLTCGLGRLSPAQLRARHRGRGDHLGKATPSSSAGSAARRSKTGRGRACCLPSC
jgi:membrane-associated protein